jgi:acyl-coenzyme A synthetase/AMP-(fatty) acid ligase
MPLERNSKNYKKIEKYYDATIIFDGHKLHFKKNLNKKNNKIFKLTEYISSTSGSTGNPKMILHKFDSIVKNSTETTKKIGYKKNKNFLIAIPGFYNSAVCHFFTCLVKEMNFFSIEDFMFPKNLKLNIKKFKINYFGGAPIQADWIIRFIKNDKNIFLEKIISSGDFLKDDTINLYLKKKIKPRLYNIYGITEVGGRVFVNDIFKSKNPFTLGESFRHFSIFKKKINKKIFEIGIKSKFNFLGYFSDKLSQTGKNKRCILHE